MKSSRPILVGIALAVAASSGAGAGVAATQAAAPVDAAIPIVRLSVDGRVNAEPSIAARGAVVAVAWAAADKAGANLYVAVSRDGGRTFGRPVQVNDRAGTVRTGGEQAPRVAIAPGDAGASRIVVVWTGREPGATSRMAESLDGGTTFAPSRMLQGNASGNRGWASFAIDDRGRSHVLWLDHRGVTNAGERAAHHQHDSGAGRSGSSGQLKLAPTTKEEAALTPGGKRADDEGVAKAQQSALFYVGPRGPKGARDADSNLEPVEVAKGVCYCCKTATATAPGGSVFAAWRHVYPGNIRDIAFTAAREGGSFTPPVRVSQDGWALDGCPEDGPALAVDGRGVAHLAWPSVVSAAQPYKAVFYAAMTGASTFAPREPVTAPGHQAAHPQIVVSFGGAPVVVWDEIVASRRSVFARMRRAGRFAAPQRLSGTATASYPAAAAVDRALVVAWRNGDPAKSTIAVRRIPLP
ncbi:MAG: hypothetical protein EXQ48_07105 [Acidobacteria bacterium]|nr:hypothetical protein [Acidobacteriota bacterium]